MTSFKKALTTVNLCAALFISAQANAANEATLTVSGSIVPAACSTTLSGAGEVSFGAIAASSIRNAPAGNTLVQLGSKDVTLSISCDAATSVGFKMIDNRASSAVTLATGTSVDGSDAQAYFGFGLGLAENDAKIGVYTVQVDTANVTADSTSSHVVFTENVANGWRKGEALPITQMNDNRRIITIGNTAETAPMMFETASFPMKVSAAVRTSSVLGYDEITLDGNATVSLVYL